MPTVCDILPRKTKIRLPSSACPSGLSGRLDPDAPEARGAVFTRVEVVEFMLDLIGYTDDKPLYEQRILEPACGEGDFVLPIIQRLLASWMRQRGHEANQWEQLGDAIYAVELHVDSYEKTCAAVEAVLLAAGIEPSIVNTLVEKWIHQGDFLLSPIKGSFDYVVGNPPYVRQELVPSLLLARYRQLYSTIYDRADLYIPFIERSLMLLSSQSRLGFICADRWMKNRYGGPLRDFIAQNYSLDVYVDMTDTPAFHEEVSAYPAITVMRKGKQGATHIAHRPNIEKKELQVLARQLLDTGERQSDFTVHHVVNGSEPWILESSDQLALLRRLEDMYPALETAGCKVGIGVATGADQAYIADMAGMDIEPDRVLPLVATKDIRTGTVVWNGKGVINPFRDNGGLVALDDYPRLKRYLQNRKEQIAKRHCSQKSPDKWYRTIDRIWPALRTTPKLLIPDIKGTAHVVYEEGEYYPHHNLYYVVSHDWDLRALQGVLLSRVAKLFVASYSTKMRGGYIRFQAQYLRRIRIPYWKDVPSDLRTELAAAATALDLNACNKAVFRLYGLNHNERSALGGNGE
ncbi:N-6 DNA methylase (plasmid) [Chlorobium phaeovibrioides]|uniref:site-specific DNA-methyltransferase (adenine-specific) n=1 Tax=Chlorobium phaeovibrioides TaxID=1094 RepID=A0A5M8I8C2_CHLPH|nr:N-6 DNA methylase [Chlorobium phaeovibrioides]